MTGAHCWRQHRRVQPIRGAAQVSRAWKIKVPGDKPEDPYLTDLGVYRGDPSALHFPPIKAGTLDFVNPDRPGVVGYWQTSNGAPWFILLTSMTHYLAYVTQMAVAAAYFAAPVTATAALPVLLVAGPLFQAMGGAGANTMHEYEGFQVAPFSGYPSKDPSTHIPEYNNDALRQVAYRGLFQLQAVGATMFGLGALWPSTLPTAAAWGILGVLAVALYFSPRDVWYARFGVGKVELLLPPLPVWPLALFGAGALLQWLALTHFFGAPFGTAVTLLLAGGGLLEAGLAEGTYDQRWHLFAVVLLNAGGWLQVAALNDLWSNSVFQGVAGAVLAGVSFMMLSPGGAVPDLIKKFTTDPPVKGAALLLAGAAAAQPQDDVSQRVINADCASRVLDRRTGISSSSSDAIVGSSEGSNKTAVVGAAKR